MQGASKESVPDITMSHFSSCKKVSLSGTLQRDFQRHVMPSELPQGSAKGKPQQDTAQSQKRDVSEICDDWKPY